VVAGATVIVRNAGTGERRTTKTDDRGNYQVQALNIGAYEVSVEHAGFREETVSEIAVAVNQNARIDASWRSAPSLASFEHRSAAIALLHLR
jgi:hypothetical protein